MSVRVKEVCGCSVGKLLLVLLLCMLDGELIGGWTCLFDKSFTSWEHGWLMFAATVLFSVNRCLESREKEKGERKERKKDRKEEKKKEERRGGERKREMIE